MSKIDKYAFSDLYSMSSGISSSKEQAGHGSPFVSFSTVFNNYFLPDTLTDLMNTSEKEQKTYSLEKDDILITRTSETIDELAMSCVVLKDYPQATYSGFTKRLRPTKKNVAYSKYMAFYLRGYLFRKAVTNNAFMTLRASFNEDIFSFLNLYLPEYKVQQRIGNLLYDMERKIALNNRIITELETMAQTIYDYWFVQFDFPNVEGKPYRQSGGEMVYNEILKREIPKEWKLTKISELANVISGFPFDSNNYVPQGTYKLITIKNVQDNGVNLDVDNYISVLPPNIPKYCILKPQDILMSLTGNVGRVGLMFTENCLLNQRVAVIQPKEKKINGGLYFLFKSNYMRNKMESIASGTSQKNLSPIDTGNLVVPLEKNVFERYSNIVNQYVIRTTILFKENLELTRLRDWLLPMLMNGQATVE